MKTILWSCTFMTLVGCQTPNASAPIEVMDEADISSMHDTETMPSGSANYAGNVLFDYATAEMNMTANFDRETVETNLHSFQSTDQPTYITTGNIAGSGTITGTTFSSTNLAGTLTTNHFAGDTSPDVIPYTGTMAGTFKGENAEAFTGTVTLQETVVDSDIASGKIWGNQ